MAAISATTERQGEEDALLEEAMKLAAAEKAALKAEKEKKANENLLQVEIEIVSDEIDPPRCAHCRIPHSDQNRLKLCAGCCRVYYCNYKCQSSHSDQHHATCSPRVVNVDTTDKRELVKEGVELQRLAREIVEQKIRPDMLRDDVIDDLADWLKEMLNGPALPLNKTRNFIEDILSDVEFVADAEIYVESHPGCPAGLFERNRNDDLKKKFYPTSMKSELRVNEEVLKWRCQSMVMEFSKRRGGVTDATLHQKATDEFYNYYLETILTRRPKIYNSCTGIGAIMGDMRFMKRSEDIVLYNLGMIKELPPETGTVTSAPPPIHTVIVFVMAMSLCIWALPTVENLDRCANVETFTTSIFKEGLFNLSPLALGIIRMVFAIICLIVTVRKMCRSIKFKLTYLSGSKLRQGSVELKGLRTQGFFTSWAWNLLGTYFFLSGLIPLLVIHGRKDVLHAHPWIVRGALIAFEIAAPCAILTSFIVTYALWPKAYKSHGASGTIGFKSGVNQFQHNANSLMVLAEVCLLGGIPVKMSHAALAPIFAGCYQLFLWCMTNYWEPKHGPLFLYFFMDTTLPGKKTTIFMVALLVVMLFFFSAFALLEMAVIKIEEGNHGALPNIAFVLILSKVLMKFKD
mmetsp:Transcript_25328/g.39762  ORF Transcript_25328/g.39762 Transcript_25328/m.39762 type:complete len:630 (-) Transcript_25328:2350-4239(-)